MIKIYNCVCGGKPKINSLLDELKWFYISCDKCKNATKGYDSLRLAARKWNKAMKELSSIQYVDISKEVTK